MSLGIDLIPRKFCSLDCVYCEVGKTTFLTTKRKEYYPVKKIQEELERYFTDSPDPDYLTFSGQGEPTLNIKIGEVIKFIKKKKPGIPVAVLTNGTLLSCEDVRRQVIEADIVLPSLDAATDETFLKINRPAKGLSVGKHIKGLVDFRKEFSGEMWLEVFILPGFNDNERDLIELKKAVEIIGPDKIQLNSLDRPGVIQGLQKATYDELKKVVDFWGLDNVEIIKSPSQRKSIVSYRKDIETTILETISRRPCTADDLTKITGLHLNEINKYLGTLEEENKIKLTLLDRNLFYSTIDGNDRK